MLNAGSGSRDYVSLDWCARRVRARARMPQHSLALRYFSATNHVLASLKSPSAAPNPQARCSEHRWMSDADIRTPRSIPALESRKRGPHHVVVRERQQLEVVAGHQVADEGDVVGSFDLGPQLAHDVERRGYLLVRNGMLDMKGHRRGCSDTRLGCRDSGQAPAGRQSVPTGPR